MLSIEQKKILYQALEDLAYDILDDIVSPVCDIPTKSIWADIFLATLHDYSWGDDVQFKEMVRRIEEKYKTKITMVQDAPLACIALHILYEAEL